VMQYYLGEDSAAEAGYRRALALDPDRPLNYRLLGQLLYAERRFAEALSPLDSALALDSRYAIAYGWRSRARLAVGDTAGARSDQEAMARLDPRVTPGTGSSGADMIFGLLVGVESTNRSPDEVLALVERAPRTLPFCRRVLKDPDFDVVREHPRFQRVVAACANVREVP
jgi:tetratricopeptide (TPR) repeat protein